MKALFLCTPDLNATNTASLLTPWCGAPIQCFQDLHVKTNHLDAANLVENLHQDIFHDSQKHWFQLASNGFNNIGHNRPPLWSKPAFESILRHQHWLVSDPRFCHTMPFWHQNLEPEIVIIAYTDPLSCALSLSKTWRFPISVGLALWEYYLLGATRQCKDQTTLVISTHKFLHDRSTFNHQFTEQLTKLGYNKEETLQIIQSAPAPVFTEFDSSNEDIQELVTDHHMTIFNQLEALQLDTVANRALSFHSHDLLSHYGDLRAGYEQIKQQRNNIQTQLDTIQQAQEHETQEPTENSNTPTATTLTNTVITNPPSNQSLSTNNSVEVSVQIKDMQPLEFICPQNAPILQTLQDVLQNPAEFTDKLVFLNYGQDANQALYFPGCNLYSLSISAL